MKDKITVFIERLKKIGIEVEVGANYPWLYLEKVNQKRVTEKYFANHGFTLAFRNKGIQFTDLREIFKIIRKYR